MKKLLALCTVAIPLVMAVPASATDAERSTNFEDVLRALVLSQFGGETRSHARSRDRGHSPGRGQARRDERQIIPIGRLVRQVQRETGGRVTSVVLRPNGRVYKIEGVGPRGRAVTARANAFTGEIFDVQRRRGGGQRHQATNGKPIPRLLRGLRDGGYRGFDRVIRDGRTYIVRGLNRRGTPVRIVANARNGRVLSVNQARRYNRPSYNRPSYNPHSVRRFN